MKRIEGSKPGGPGLSLALGVSPFKRSGSQAAGDWMEETLEDGIEDRLVQDPPPAFASAPAAIAPEPAPPTVEGKKRRR